MEDNEVEENVNIPYNNQQQQHKMKAVLFIYPNYSDPIFLYDLEDLHDEDLCVFCQNPEDDSQNKKVFVWRGISFSDFEVNYIEIL